MATKIPPTPQSPTPQAPTSKLPTPPQASFRSSLRLIRFWDRFAHVVIVSAGGLIILAVLGILLQISLVALPLFLEARAIPTPLADGTPGTTQTPGSAAPAAVRWLGVDAYRAFTFTLDAHGVYQASPLEAERPHEPPILSLPPPQHDAAPGEAAGRDTRTSSDSTPENTVRSVSGDTLSQTLSWRDGSITVEQLLSTPLFDDDGTRRIELRPWRAAQFNLPQVLATHGIQDADARSGMHTGIHSVIIRAEDNDDTQVSVTVALAGGRLLLWQQSTTENFLGVREQQVQSYLLTLPRADAEITAHTLGNDARRLYVASQLGPVWIWDVRAGSAPVLTGEIELAPAVRGREAVLVRSIAAILGDRSVVLGTNTGELRIWSPLNLKDAQGQDELVWTEIHRIAATADTAEGIPAAAITRVLALAEQKMFFTQDQTGLLRLYYPTTERLLLSLPLAAGSVFNVNSRSNALVALSPTADQTLLSWKLDVPHPEGSWRSYFSRLWYEEFSRPAYIWQSSSATSDTEPKLSLMPLLFGTLKGTLYCMFFAAPLAILAALYTSQLMHPRLKRTIKPAFELIGAVPTVVLGFMAAFWLAPILRDNLGTMLLLLAFLPLTVFCWVFLLERLAAREQLRHHLQGREFLLLIPALLLGCYSAYLSGGLIERIFFDGDLARWLYQEWDIQYSQRNALVIALALGITVMPSIFTLSEEAISNVPRHLAAASLALGASRWQTVWLILLPSAIPGIFAALMVGLGRAVGETMIVLMATGNTPIIDLSPFNGMRTLSANIAVEIPEAPQNGTLYRVLFLSGALLFMLTFIVNSLAEWIRLRLRRRF